MDRRQWLTRTSLAIAGGLLLGNEAMEMYEKLTHKKVWAMGGMKHGPRMVIVREECSVFGKSLMEEMVLMQNRFTPPGQYVYMHPNVLQRWMRV